MENNSYDSYIRMRKRQSHRGTVTLCIILGVLLILTGGVFAFFALYRPNVTPSGSDGVEQEGDLGEKPNVEAGLGERKDGIYTFFIAGLDDASLNTDVMMLASVNVPEKKVSVVQLPRDTFINKSVGGYSYAVTANAMFSSYFHTHQVPALGTVSDAAREMILASARKDSMRSVCTQLEKSLGIRVDRFVLLDTAAFRQIVDAVGGVTFNVPMNMDYDDPYQDLHIHLQAGEQLLSGEQAEGLIRFRSGYLGGDLDRMDVRADFLRAMATEVKNKLTLSSLLSIVRICSDSVYTDMTPEDELYFARAVYGMPSENLLIKTIGGSVVQNPETGAWRYFSLHKETALSDVNRYLNVYTEPVAEDEFDKNGFFTDAVSAANRYLYDYYSS